MKFYVHDWVFEVKDMDPVSLSGRFSWSLSWVLYLTSGISFAYTGFQANLIR